VKGLTWGEKLKANHGSIKGRSGGQESQAHRQVYQTPPTAYVEGKGKKNEPQEGFGKLLKGGS